MKVIRSRAGQIAIIFLFLNLVVVNIFAQNNESVRLDGDSVNGDNVSLYLPLVMGPPFIGEGILFSTDRDGNREIYVMAADGSGQTNLTNDPDNDVEPSWSPDGTRIAFASNRSPQIFSNHYIYIMNADGTNAVRLEASEGGREPDWSPDGQSIVFALGDHIYQMDADGSNLKQVVFTDSAESSPDLSPNGQQIPLGDLVDIKYEQGPQAIKSEDGFLVGYVLFDKMDGFSEVELVKAAEAYFDSKIEVGALKVPTGITYKFAGNYEQQVRANKRLGIVLPISLILIFLILYFQFKSVITSLFVFSGVFIAFSGGFIMIWLFGQDWFMNFDFFGTNMRELFQMRPINLSVAVWVGFLALFGIATDDGVLVATFLKQSFKSNKPNTLEEIKEAVVEGGLRRVKPAMMTTATTILALLPILTSTGKGSDIMLPMAIPSFGGMVFNMITMFTVPVLYFIWQEQKFKWELKRPQSSNSKQIEDEKL